MFSLRQTKPLSPFHVLYFAKNVREFYDFLMFVKRNVLKENIGVMIWVVMFPNENLR